MKLNAEQVQAVTTTDVPVMVLAGPGTGKTAMMVQKYRHLVTKEGLDPDRILITTFTRKATEELEERIAEALEADGHYSKVTVQNFHSFCLNLLRSYPTETGLPQDPPILDGVQLRRFMLEHRDRLSWATVPFVRWVHTPLERLQAFMGGCLSGAVSPEEAVKRATKLVDSADAKGRRKAAELLDYAGNYGRVLDLLRDEGILTYDLILFDAVRLLEQHEDIRLEVQDAYDYLLVDEVQDNNGLQARLVELIVGDRGCVTVVGDEDQGIYKFRGAERDILQRFKDQFSPKRIDLSKNYRSSHAIVQAGQALISHNADRFDGKILEAHGANKDHQIQPVVTAYRNEEQEMLHLAKAIEDQIAAGRRPRDIAVLFRSLNHKERLIPELEARGIRYEVTNVAQLLRMPEVRDLWAWLSVLADPVADNPALERVLQSREVGLPILELAKVQERFHRLVQERKENPPPQRDDFDDDAAYREAVTEFETRSAELDAEGAPRSGYHNLVELLRGLDGRYIDDNARHRLRWARRSIEVLSDKVRGRTALEAAHNILGWLKPQRRYPPSDARHAQSWANLGDFLNVIKDYEQSYPNAGGLREFMEYLDYLDRQGAEFQEREPDTTEDSVKILTAHRAKGLQWPVVFIPACNKQRFPAPYRGDWLAPLLRPDTDPREDHLAEERRVFYVAMTRAEQELHLTHALSVSNRERARSPFLDEILDAGVATERVEEEDLQPTETDADRRDDQEYAIIHGALTEVAADADELADRLKRILAAVSRTWSARMDVKLLQGAFQQAGVPFPTEAIEETADAEPAPVRQRLRLSASALKTYATCPRKYQFQYVMRIPQKINPNAVAGSNVHRALEVFHKRCRDDWREQPIEELLSIHDEVLAETRFSSPEEAEQWRALDERILRDYLESERNTPGEPSHFEAMVRLEMPEADAEFIGYIDRMDEHSDGSIEIIDYKTGAIQKEQGTVANDWQLPLYILGMEAKGRTVRAATLYGMKDAADGSGTIQRIRIPRMAEGNDKREFTDAVMDRFKERVVEAVEGMRSGEYPEHVDDRECGFCDYRLLCPAWEQEP